MAMIEVKNLSKSFKDGDTENLLFTNLSLNIEQGAGVGIVALVLRKDGFFDQQVRLDAARDQSESVTLDPVPGAAPAAKAPPSAGSRSPVTSDSVAGTSG